jgi:hypothetical protein
VFYFSTVLKQDPSAPLIPMAGCSLEDEVPSQFVPDFKSQGERQRLSITKYDSESLRLIYFAYLNQIPELRIAMRQKPVPKKVIAPDDREFVSGFIRLHILHPAALQPCSLWWVIG